MEKGRPSGRPFLIVGIFAPLSGLAQVRAEQVVRRFSALRQMERRGHLHFGNGPVIVGRLEVAAGGMDQVLDQKTGYGPSVFYRRSL